MSRGEREGQESMMERMKRMKRMSREQGTGNKIESERVEGLLFHVISRTHGISNNKRQVNNAQALSNVSKE